MIKHLCIFPTLNKMKIAPSSVLRRLSSVLRHHSPSAVRPSPAPVHICHLAYTFYENDNRVIRYAETMVEQGADVDVIALRRKEQSSYESLGSSSNLSSQTHHSISIHLFRIQQRIINEKKPPPL